MNHGSATEPATGSQSLPDYRVRHSTRARHINLKISPIDGLVVVVPAGFDERLIPALLIEQREWIDARLQQLRIDDTAFVRPERIDLPAADESWHVEYRRSNSASVRTNNGADRTVSVSGNIDDETALRAALRRWLSRQAERILVPRLAALAETHAFSYQRASIRQQRSRWGSCSTTGTISLNARLVFARPALVDHVLLHELCHLSHRDHGPDFHALLARLDPQHREHARELRDIWPQMPSWAIR